MNQVNARGTFLCSKLCLPHLLKADNPHILNLSPPLNMETHWFENHVAYTMAKFGMSMCVLGMAGEFKNKVAVNALWPRTAILHATAAVGNLMGGEDTMKRCRRPEIMGDAAPRHLDHAPQGAQRPVLGGRSVPAQPRRHGFQPIRRRTRQRARAGLLHLIAGATPPPRCRPRVALVSPCCRPRVARPSLSPAHFERPMPWPS